MAILTPINLQAEVVFLGLNPDRSAGPECHPVPSAELTYEGMQGDAHAGAERLACSRMKGQYPKGVPIRNARQLSIVSAEELAEIGEAMGLGEALRPEWLGANIMLRGLPRLTETPPGSRLIFSSGAGLVVDLENEPCSIVAKAIEAHRPGKGSTFKKHARAKRGVTAWVERCGALELGMKCMPHTPPQRIWSPGGLGL